jgi:hypothetical protein
LSETLYDVLGVRLFRVVSNNFRKYFLIVKNYSVSDDVK